MSNVGYSLHAVDAHISRVTIVFTIIFILASYFFTNFRATPFMQ